MKFPQYFQCPINGVRDVPSNIMPMFIKQKDLTKTKVTTVLKMGKSNNGVCWLKTTRTNHTLKQQRKSTAEVLNNSDSS